MCWRKAAIFLNFVINNGHVIMSLGGQNCSLRASSFFEHAQISLASNHSLWAGKMSQEDGLEEEFKERCAEKLPEHVSAAEPYVVFCAIC